MTEPTDRPDVPDELVYDAVDAWHNAPRNDRGAILLDDLMRHILAAVLPTHARRVREQVAAGLRADADAHRRLVARKPSEYDEARLARARTLDDAAARIPRMRSKS